MYGPDSLLAVCSIRSHRRTIKSSTCQRVEREFGRLKNEYGLTPLRTRGLERVRLHADLVMIARLGQALVRARAVLLAA
jgi:hypothetical protein